MKLVCPKCGKEFGKKFELYRHIKKRKNEKGEYFTGWDKISLYFYNKNLNGGF